MKHLRNVLLFNVLLWFSLPLCGQISSAVQEQTHESTFPDSPSFTMLSQSEAMLSLMDFRAFPEVFPAVAIERRPAKESHKILDKKFLLLTVYDFSATVADIESTEHALSVGDHESNPLLGYYPSRGKLYAIGISSAALTTLLSYELKKRDPHSRMWMLPSVLGGALHGFAAIHNVYVSHD
jgi:hypothetical protein